MSVPECVATNALLSCCMSTSDEWITQRTGIRERRVSPDTYRMLLRLAEAPDKAACMRDIRDRGLDGCIELWGSSTFPPVSKKKIDDGRSRPRMNGRAVFVNAVRRVREVLQECLDANRLRPSDVDCYLFHQANLRIIEAATGHFGIPPERCFNNTDRYGNTAGASVPICVHEALSEGRIKDGDLVMLVAFGTGFSWGATLLRW